MPTPRDDKNDDKQRSPKQPAQSNQTYPEGLEDERQEPAGGQDKPRPSDSGHQREG